MSAAPGGPESGATLLETLIALAIASLLAAAASQVAGLGLSTVEWAETASVRSAAAYLDDRRLRDRLTLIDAGEDSFAGGPDALRWRGPGDDGAASVWRLGADGRLAACASLDALRCGPAADWLGAPVEGFAYAGPDGVWVDDWPTGAPPDLVRATFAAGEVVIAPRVRGAR